MTLKWEKRLGAYRAEFGKWRATVYRENDGWQCAVGTQYGTYYREYGFATRAEAQADAERWIEEHGE